MIGRTRNTAIEVSQVIISVVLKVSNDVNVSRVLEVSSDVNFSGVLKVSSDANVSVMPRVRVMSKGVNCKRVLFTVTEGVISASVCRLRLNFSGRYWNARHRLDRWCC